MNIYIKYELKFDLNKKKIPQKSQKPTFLWDIFFLSITKSSSPHASGPHASAQSY